MKYKIIRFYKDHPMERLTVRRGLTLEEAQEWCNDPETSSSTCTTESGLAHTEEWGPWFDGYDEEKPRYSGGGGYDYHSRGAPESDITGALMRGQF